MSALQQILAIGAAAFVLVVAIILVWSLAVKRDDQSGGGRESIAGGDAVHDDSAPVEDLPHDGLAAGGAPPPDASVSAEDQSPDALSPEGSIEVPASGAVLAGPDVVLSGSATDAVGVTRVLVTIRDTVSKLWLQPDGATFGSVESSVQASLDSPGGTSTAWSLAVSLPDGSYAIGIRTFDDTGNVDAAPPWVPFTVASVPADTVSPTGFVDVPVSGAVLAGPSVVLSGSASDDVGVTDVKVTIRDTVGELWLQADAATFGSTYTLLSAELDAPNEPETGWRFALSLPDGTYAIGIKASDAAGNVDASPPWVPFTVAIPKPEAKKSAPRAAKTARQPRKAASGGPPR